VETHLSLIVSHRTPLGGSENALLRCFSLITENLLDQLRIRADPLEEHEVGAKGLLWRVWVLHVGLSGLAGLALGGPESVLSFDIVGSEGAHVSRELPLPGVFGSLGHALIFLDSAGPWSEIGETKTKYRTDLLLSGAEVCILLAGLLGSLGNVELLGGVGLSPLNEIGKVELPRGRSKLRRFEHGLLRC
jgi:hypothetical protein